jgi:Integrase core domain/Chromo (CHRromatin Organisation MOdifier) domain
MESYFNLRLPESFGGVRGLVRQSSRNAKEVREWLMSQNAYTLHKQTKSRFRRRKTYSHGIDDLWQADLVDLSSISNYNDSYRYLLTCIDVFSRYARAVPLKNKSGSTLVKAFSSMIAARKPAFLQTDKGTEFKNAAFQSLLRDNDIKFYTSENDDIKCALIERWHRTLKSKMWRYFTYKSTLRYVDVLDDMVASYNDSHHRSIKMAPSEVNIQNEGDLRQRLYSAKKPPLKWKYAEGDTVRIKQSKRTFKKGYLPSWTEEIFFIDSRFPSDPPTYKLKDYADEKIEGKFYAEELQKISKTDDTFKVERVLKSRKRNGRTEFFVKWSGYPDKFNSWTESIIDGDG